jgi:2',3'-cyclic-nucleotide 2'-phosphodiesterase (5'-nucleotidase family)
LARRATLIDSLRAGNPSFLLLDAGDFVDQSRNVVAGKPKSDFILRAYGRLGYDAVTFGEREFSFGDSAFPIEGPDTPPVVLSNVYRVTDDGTERVALPYVIKDAGGVKVGIFGLSSKPKAPVHREVPHYESRNPYETAEEILQALDDEGAEVVVLLSQLNRSEADSLLRRFDGIDFAIMGHPSTPYRGKKDHPYVAAPIFSGRRGQSLGYASFSVDPDGGVISVNTKLVQILPEMAVNAPMEELVNEMEAEINRLKEEWVLNQQLESERKTEIDHYLGTLACARCHEKEHEHWLGTAHAHAYQTLLDLGMQQTTECLPCHVVGFNEDSGFRSQSAEPNLAGVQCESCHGIGSMHYDESLTHQTTEKMCVSCHDEANSPDFDYQDYLDAVRHW